MTQALDDKHYDMEYSKRVHNIWRIYEKISIKYKMWIASEQSSFQYSHIYSC